MHNRKIVLDFDGTIFRLFANYDLFGTIKKISSCMKKYDIDFPLNSDIFDAFEYQQKKTLDLTTKEQLYKEVNSLVIQAEIDALSSGIMIDGFKDFLNFTKKENIQISIISNNSKECIDEFLKRYCDGLNLFVIGRDYMHPELMKPHTYMLEETCKLLSWEKDSIIFVGDNPRDYECAKNLGVNFIALAPTQKKYDRFLENKINVKIVKNFYELIDEISPII